MPGRARAGLARDPTLGEILERSLRAEVHPSLDHRARYRAHRIGACTGQADRGEIGIGQRLRRREQMFETWRERRGQRLSKTLRQPRRERTRRRDADLLAQDRAHGDLEAGPAAGKAQARSLRYQGRQAIVCAEH